MECTAVVALTWSRIPKMIGARGQSPSPRQSPPDSRVPCAHIRETGIPSGTDSCSDGYSFRDLRWLNWYLFKDIRCGDLPSLPKKCDRWQASVWGDREVSDPPCPPGARERGGRGRGAGRRVSQRVGSRDRVTTRYVTRHTKHTSRPFSDRQSLIIVCC